MSRYLLILFLLVLIPQTYASETIYQFEQPHQEKLYNQLIVEFRCLVCQNQNIADSDADLAKDLRQKTYELIVAGKDEHYIKSFMQSRYGDFVLYEPPLNQATWWLWAMPLMVLLIALFFIYLAFRRYQRESAAS